MVIQHLLLMLERAAQAVVQMEGRKQMGQMLRLIPVAEVAVLVSRGHLQSLVQAAQVAPV